MTGLDCPSCGEKDDEFVYCLGIGCEVEHTYMHGWTMSGSPSFDPAAMFVDSSNGDAAVAGCLFHDNIVDGSDSSQNGFTGPSYCQTVYNNYVKYVHVCYFWNMNVIHDNVCEDIVISITGDHANGYAWFGLIGGATNGLFYNNIQRHSTACSGCVNFYLFQLTSANSGYHVYFFNNLGYDMDAANIVDLAGSGASGNYGTWYLFNNTIECGNDSSQTTCYNGQSGVTMALSDINNHWIGPRTAPRSAEEKVSRGLAPLRLHWRKPSQRPTRSDIPVPRPMLSRPPAAVRLRSAPELPRVRSARRSAESTQRQERLAETQLVMGLLTIQAITR